MARADNWSHIVSPTTHGPCLTSFWQYETIMVYNGLLYSEHIEGQHAKDRLAGFNFSNR